MDLTLVKQLLNLQIAAFNNHNSGKTSSSVYIHVLFSMAIAQLVVEIFFFFVLMFKEFISFLGLVLSYF